MISGKTYLIEQENDPTKTLPEILVDVLLMSKLRYDLYRFNQSKIHLTSLT